MMISVKATKTKAPESDSAERYVLKTEPRNSRAPYVIGAVLSAIALYVKSAVYSMAKEEEGNPAGGAKGSGAVSHSVSDEILPPSEEAPDETPEEFTSASQGAFSLTPSVSQSNFPIMAHGHSSIGKKISGSPKMAANTDAPPVSGPSEQDYLHMFTSTAEFAAAWARGENEEVAAPPGNTLEPRNKEPRAGRPTQLLDVASGAVLFIALSDLLANITDPDGDTLAVVTASVSSGTLVEVEGGFMFRPEPDALGPVQLSFTVSDGEASIVDVAHFAVVPNLIEGTDQADMVSGGRFIDQIRGLDGNDNIDGLAGSDIIDGGAGDDNVSGGAGDDVIFGGVGNDNILGGAGNDRISGGDGDDNLFGDAGDDVLFGDAGNDTISDGTGADVVFGGDGDDLVIASPDGDDDFYDGGEGRDTLDYSNVASGMNVDLVAHLVSGAEVGSDTISNFEVIKLGSGDDHVLVGAEEVTLFGGGGANTFEFIDLAPVSALTVMAHQIMDFGLGDLIKTSKHLIFSKSDDAKEDLFDAMHGDGKRNDDAGSIRYRYETYDDHEETIVEWDNDDFSQLTVVTLQGHHNLTWADHS